MTDLNEIANAVQAFKESQTFSNLQDVVNLGLTMQRLESNRWVNGWGRFELPIEGHRIVTLYEKNNGTFVPIAIGIY